MRSLVIFFRPLYVLMLNIGYTQRVLRKLLILAVFSVVSVVGLQAVPPTAQAAGFRVTLLSIDKGVYIPVYKTPSTRYQLTQGGSELLVEGRYWILARRGDWVGISTVARHDNKLAWVNIKEYEEFVSEVQTTRRVIVDRSAKTLRVELDGKTLYRARVAVGRPSAPTPLGRTSIEDILRPQSVGLPSSYYGAWIMQLGLWQKNASPGFPNGGATAFHGTPNPSDRGRAVSAGCIRLEHRNLVALKKYVTIGTPVIIQR